MNPTPEQVAAEVAEVWALVAELTDTPGGIELMDQAAADYPLHEE